METSNLEGHPACSEARVATKFVTKLCNSWQLEEEYGRLDCILQFLCGHSPPLAAAQENPDYYPNLLYSSAIWQDFHKFLAKFVAKRASPRDGSFNLGAPPLAPKHAWSQNCKKFMQFF